MISPAPHSRLGEISILHLTASKGGTGIVSARLAPGRGMMLISAEARMADGRLVEVVSAPDDGEIARRLDGGPDDFAGNGAFSFGGAVLAPFANRVRGSVLPGREIEVAIGSRRVRLPANWSGKAAGAEPYAMHGRLLDRAAQGVISSAESAKGRLLLPAKEELWPSELAFDVAWTLREGGLELQVTAINHGDQRSPVGIGWHPYFNMPSGDRTQARLSVPAATRLVVGDYDQVLPTGERVAVEGTAYDMRAPTGRPLGELYLDDCFADLERRSDGAVVCALFDPAGDYAVRVRTPSPGVKFVQVYAPIDRPVVAIEPQFNLADPFGAIWGRDVDTGMAWLEPGESAEYRLRVEVGPSPADPTARSPG
jgi:aldose 1-epimerase